MNIRCNDKRGRGFEVIAIFGALASLNVLGREGSAKACPNVYGNCPR